MGVTGDALPEGRYGRGTPDTSSRRLRWVGGLLGLGFLGLICWIGWSYIAGQEVSGELIRYQVVSDDTVRVHLEVRKDADAIGVCTLRSLGRDGAEVGLKDVRITQRGGQVDTVVTVHTRARATNAELIGCQLQQ